MRWITSECGHRSSGRSDRGETSSDAPPFLGDEGLVSLFAPPCRPTEAASRTAGRPGPTGTAASGGRMTTGHRSASLLRCNLGKNDVSRPRCRFLPRHAVSEATYHHKDRPTLRIELGRPDPAPTLELERLLPEKPQSRLHKIRYGTLHGLKLRVPTHPRRCRLRIVMPAALRHCEFCEGQVLQGR